MKIEAILFDMDGVLIEARDWHYEALNRALALFGMEIDRDAHLSTFDGIPTKKKLTILTESRGLPALLHDFINSLKQKYTLEIATALCKPVFHHQFALSRLKAEDFKMAVCSNSVRNTVRMFMHLSRLEDFLDAQISNQDVTEPKPDPEMYLAAMRKLEVEPEHTLILEDNEYGIQAARSSGAHLMIVESINGVTYERIKQRILDIENEGLRSQ